ncbi:MAG: adenylyl-sulfate kinase, partial [Bacillota bacterium]|nr:adenylyl-sulfate kinase [Bacillota bacterium]
ARGEIASLTNEAKPKIATRIRANLFWLGKEPMISGKKYFLKLGTAKVGVRLEQISRLVDAVNLSQQQQKEIIEQNDVAECILSLDKAIAFDLASNLAKTSRFVIVDKYEIAGGGIIQEELADSQQNKGNLLNLSWHSGKVSYDDRCKRLNQQGIVILLTGLSGSGKSTIAVELEKELFGLNKSTYILDGDNIRHGLNSDLGFTYQDREENIRRIAEVATLFKDAGLITILSAIAPTNNMRDMIREKVGSNNYIEVYVKADIKTCAARDPKGLYKKAKSGEITNFTGISSSYEEPRNPDLVIDTEKVSINESVSKVLELLEAKFSREII